MPRKNKITYNTGKCTLAEKPEIEQIVYVSFEKLSIVQSAEVQK